MNFNEIKFGQAEVLFEIPLTEEKIKCSQCQRIKDCFLAKVKHNGNDEYLCSVRCWSKWNFHKK